MTVRCRACHDELLKACAERAELVSKVATLTEELRISRAKSRRYKQEQKAAEAERDAARQELREYVAKNPNF